MTITEQMLISVILTNKNNQGNLLVLVLPKPSA